jgi:prepilin-type N-terminal cleavage/methylation domain-containing protein
MRKAHTHPKSYGFTIVELLVALAVFSVVLVVVTAAIIQISRVYYKGFTETQVQTTARTVMDTISQGIQFGGGTIIGTPTSQTPGTSYAFCLGNQEYSFRPGYQLVDTTPGIDQTNNALVVRTTAACSGTSAQNLAGAVTGREMLAPRMRLSKMVVKSVGTNLYQIQIRLVYGDDDLLVSPSGSPNGPKATDAACKGQDGRQFCAVSELNTTVIRRVK